MFVIGCSWAKVERHGGTGSERGVSGTGGNRLGGANYVLVSLLQG